MTFVHYAVLISSIYLAASFLCSKAFDRICLTGIGVMWIVMAIIAMVVK